MRVARAAAAAVSVAALSAAARAAMESAPQLSGTGAPATPPPVVKDAHGAAVPLRLVSVQVAFRHGARTPIEDAGARRDGCLWLPEDTEKAELARCGRVSLYRPGSCDAMDPSIVFAKPDEPQWSMSATLHGGGLPGRLTSSGLAQAVALGADLRRRYVDADATASSDVSSSKLLPSAWASARRLVTARSTCVERTVYSAQGVLAGLFPAAAADGSLATDVELSGGRSEDEFMVLFDTGCLRLNQLFSQGLHLAAQNLDAAQQNCIAHVEGGAGGAWRSDAPEWKLIAYRDWYACRKACGKPLPHHVEEVATELDAASARNMHAIFEGGAPFTPLPDATRREAVRLAIGRMLGMIVERLERPDGVLHLYSGHDWTVTPLLMAVCRPDEPALSAWPPFCSSISFELWSSRPGDAPLSHWARAGAPSASAEGRYVRVLWNGAPIRLTASGEEVCSLADFRRAVTPFLVGDYECECRPVPPPMVQPAEDHHMPVGAGVPDFNK